MLEEVKKNVLEIHVKRGIKLKYYQLLDGNLGLAVDALAQVKGETSAVFNLLRIQRRMQAEQQKAAETHKKLAAPFFKKDEKGELIPSPRPTSLAQYAIEEGAEIEFQKKMEEFLGTECEIESYRIDLKDFQEFKPTVQQLAYLEPLLDEEAHPKL